MFITRPGFAVHLPPFAGLENCSGWDAVELAAALPCYVLDAQWRDRRGVALARRTFMFSRIPTLVAALESMNTEGDGGLHPFGIVGVYPPGFDNTTDDWISRPIREVWTAEAKLDGSLCEVVLVTLDGNTQVIEPPLGEIDMSKVQRVRRIYPLNRRGKSDHRQVARRRTAPT